MADEGYLLSRDDRDILNEVVRAYRAGLLNPRGRSRQDRDDHLAPEVYIALTPSGGVPARVGLTPGTATCVIYRIIDGVLEQSTAIDRDVYNLSETAVDGNIYTPVLRDKAGSWLVLSVSGSGEVEAGTGTGPDALDCESLAALDVSDCILATSTYDGSATILEYSGPGWDGGDTMAYPGGSGLLEFWYEDGRPHLTLNNLELLWCSGNCFVGGPLTGHVPQGYTGTGTGTGTYEVCAGETFRICLTCTECCDLEGYTGANWYCARTVSACLGYVLLINVPSLTGVGNVVEFYIDATLILSVEVPGGGYTDSGVKLYRTDSSISDYTGFFDAAGTQADLGLYYPATTPSTRVWTALSASLLNAGTHQITINVVDNGAGNPLADAEVAVIKVAYDGTQWVYDGVLLDLYVENADAVDSQFDFVTIPTEEECTAVYLTSMDQCNTCLEICSGSYNSEAEALASGCPECITGVDCNGAPVLDWDVPYVVKLCSGGVHWVQLPITGVHLEDARLEVEADTSGAEVAGVYWNGTCASLFGAGSFPNQSTPMCTDYAAPGGTSPGVGSFIQLTLDANVTYTITTRKGFC